MVGLSLPALALLATIGPQDVFFDPPEPRVGDLVVIYVESRDPSLQTGEVQLLGYEMQLMRVSEKLLRAIAAIPTDIEPKMYEVDVIVDDKPIRVPLTVSDRDFETSELKVSKRFTKPKSKQLRRRLKREQRQMQQVWEADSTLPVHRGAFLRPVSGRRTSPFGVRRLFNGATKSVHYGLDLDGRIGDPVRAVGDGRVVMSSMRWTSGGTVILDHGGGLMTAYFHLSKRLVKVGARVKRGKLIGHVGKSGRVTGPHLHLSVIVRAMRLSGPLAGIARGFYVDPEPLFTLLMRGRERLPYSAKDRGG